MKKVLAICLMATLVVCMTVPAFAATNFVSSPSGEPAPEIISFDPKDEACTAKADAYSYGDRDQLPTERRELFEDAYDTIVSAEDLTKLCDGLADAIKGQDIKPKDLAVSDLFDIYETDCEGHENHKQFELVLGFEKLNGFVGLMQLNKETGKWEFVSDAAVTSNGTRIRFSVENLSPFAVVVNTKNPDGPKTGDDSLVYAFVAVTAAAAAVVMLAVAEREKRRA